MNLHYKSSKYEINILKFVLLPGLLFYFSDCLAVSDAVNPFNS